MSYKSNKTFHDKKPKEPACIGSAQSQLNAVAARPGETDPLSTAKGHSSRLLTIPTFCHEYATGRTTAYALIKSNAVVAVKIGRSTRITAESADDWFTRLVAVATAVKND